ncbi:MAG: 2,3-bisphosphoglycerate-independent phosphoglycerate mutase [Parcubacteria group bacterium Gr01-1014_31]|nr:MAG: 2,3-bisphosphoglycerate-independent phosphoglycerate mutase [Parcubacteria group bacterium Gr01-1014_31]
MARPKPVVLVVLDGWGVAPPSPTNAISRAKTPVFDRLVAEYPVLTLQASGEAVGLLWGEMGNSEVGHLSMGSGRIVYQTLPKINKAISDGTFSATAAIQRAFAHLRETPGAQLHLVGLVSNGGVHSHQEHLFALLDCCQANNVKPLVHVILDGRDTARDAGADAVAQLGQKLAAVGGQVSTVAGRFWSMDRDSHWERIERSYQAMTKGDGQTATDAVAAIRQSYAQGVFDEEFAPCTLVQGGFPVGLVRDRDAVIFFNFRADRARQLTASFVLPGFAKFERPYLRDLYFVTMTEYDKDLPVEIAFPPDYVREPVAKVMAEAGLRQLHIAETEKYAHVTFFFNGGREEPFPGEDRALIPSPRVSSYALQPQMSAYELTTRLLDDLRRGVYDFVVANYANVDMVGHTGNLQATVRAVEVIDECLGKVVAAVLEAGGVLLITADHGNAEELVSLQSGEINKEHSTSPVPLLIVGASYAGRAARRGPDIVGSDLSIIMPSGVLADLGPTVLQLLELSVPAEMSGHSLL